MESGSRLGPYEIVEPLGAGGMGEVYRARDPRLDRDVAIKVLPPDFGADPERLARFDREAKTLAALSHANIAAIYGLEQDDEVRFIAMELVEGETLEERIRRKGVLGLDEALGLARQIADALRAAHDSDVVHRDLKPANVQVTPDGVVKVLDFGLAKTHPGAYRASGSAPDQTQSPTMMQATGAGVILGTAAYMSPEQAKGKVVDKRADIWAFGAVLYEMLAGKKLFAREDVSETLASVIRDDPDLSALPRPVRPLLDRCLQKDPAKRLRDIGDAWLLLDAATELAGAASSTAGGSKLPWVIATAAVLALLATLTAVPRGRDAARPTRPVRFQLPWPDEDPVQTTRRPMFSLSPDGRAIALTDSGRLWVRRLDSLTIEPVPDTAGGTYPFWSPDGDWLGFFADEQLKKTSLETGLAQVIADAPVGRGASWSRQGMIVFSREITTGGHQAIFAVDEGGGEVLQLTALSDGAPESDAHRYPQFLADGEHFLFLYLSSDPEVRGTYLGRLDPTPPVRILEGLEVSVYAPPSRPENFGHLLYRRGETLVAQALDAEAGEVVGRGIPIADGVGGAGNTGYVAVSVAADGTLAYSADQERDRAVVWLDRSGALLETVIERVDLESHDLAADDSRFAFAAGGIVRLESDSRRTVYVQALPDGVAFPLADHMGSGPGWTGPILAPDGRRIAYTTPGLAGLGNYEVWRRAADLSGTPTLIASGRQVWHLWDWSPDGSVLLFTDGFEGGDLQVLAVDRGGDPSIVAGGPGTQLSGQFSPDGRWLAYTTAQVGRAQVYVQHYPTTGAVWQVSRNGGDMVRWRADGNELFYRAADGQLMALPVTFSTASGDSAPVFEPGPASALFEVPESARTTGGWSYSVSVDGQRFLVALPVAGTKIPITVVLDWQADLEE